MFSCDSKINALRTAVALACVFLAPCIDSALAAAGKAPINPQVMEWQPAKQQVRDDSWGFREGAPERVAGLAQTADGFLWLGSESGLVRFDGTRFEAIRSLLGDKLLSTNVQILFAPREGGLWVGFASGPDGYSFLKNGRVTNYALSGLGLTGAFAEDRQGIIWSGTTVGLWRFDHTRWSHLGAESNAPLTPVLKIAFDAKGTLWVLTGNDYEATLLLYLLPGAQRFEIAEHLVRRTFLVDASGAVVTHPRSRQGDAPDTSGNLTHGPADFPVLIEGSQIALMDRTGSIWIDKIDPNDTTISRILAPTNLDGAANLSTLPAAGTYSIDPYSALGLVDQEGGIWFGTPKGIHRFSYSPLIREEGVSPDISGLVVVADADGSVWIGSQGVLQRSSHGVIETVRKLDGRTKFAYMAPDKTFWLATKRSLWHFARGNWFQIDLPPDMIGSYLQTIAQDRNGGMWISFGRRGLFRFADGKWTPNGGHADLPKSSVVIEFSDNTGRVWFGYTNNQLAVLDAADQVRVFGPSEGIGVGSITAISGRGTEIWIGGEFGLLLFDHGQFHHIAAVDDEWLRGISGIVETANTDLWLYGLAGILNIRRAEIAEALRDPTHLVHGQHFGRREGVPGVAEQLRPLPSAIEGSDGKVWFAGSSGVAWLDPTVPEHAVRAPLVTIESASADDKVYALDRRMQFPAHTADVQLSFAAPSLANPEAIRYRYKLEETDKEWHEVREANPVNYRNLSAGSYHFSVSSTDTDGVWSDRVATVAFTILPAFYRTPWFTTLCIAAALAALYLVYLLWTRQLARDFNLTLEARVNERTRIARDLHDTLLQSFHGLLLQFQTAYKLLPGRPAEAKRTLETAIDSAFQAITEGRDTVQGLRDSTVAGKDLAEAIKILGEELASQEREGSPVLQRVDVTGTPQPLRPLVRDEIYRIAGESLRNAFQHAGATRIEVDFCYGDAWIRLRVRDDGKGIDPVFLREDAPARHYGIHGMRERAKLMGGTLGVWTAPNSGTEVELRVPASRAYEASSAATRRWPILKAFRRSASIES